MQPLQVTMSLLIRGYLTEYANFNSVPTSHQFIHTSFIKIYPSTEAVVFKLSFMKSWGSTSNLLEFHKHISLVLKMVSIIFIILKAYYFPPPFVRNRHRFSL